MGKNNKNKKIKMRKLIPALGMLAMSTVMLSTSTYAWFTMSKEVEITGIQLTATTPELIEISFGTVSATGELQAPSPDADASEWVHSAATGSVYSSFGKLMPTSSIDGYNMYNTTNATGFGKSVVNANDFEQSSTAAQKTLRDSSTTTETHENIGTEGTEGYYVDIPVWFRTTKTEAIQLGVIAKIQNPGSYNNQAGGEDDETELYKAARVSILKPNAEEDATADIAGTQTNTTVIMDSEASYYTVHRTDAAPNQAVKAIGTGADSWSEVYGNVSKCIQVIYADGVVTNATTATSVATITERTEAQGSGYSTPTKYIIRVWLEGEDEACWNANAAQSFVVGLQFYDLSNTN